MKQRYDDHLLEEIDKLYDCAFKLPELSYVIDKNWTKRIKNVVVSWGPERKFNDGGYNFFRDLTGCIPIVPPSIKPEDLDHRLQSIERVARAQRKIKDYKKTRNELGSEQINQILGALFEINILSTLIEAAPTTVELYPKVGNGNKNVDARVNVDGRFVYVEAKAIGCSKYDRHSNYVGLHSFDSMSQQIREALNSKLGEDKQLRLAASSAPTVLCLSLGFNADNFFSSTEIKNYLSYDTTNVSCVFMAGSVFCNKGMIHFRNGHSSFPLTADECRFFESVFRTIYYDS
jgi:hypothetical protein